jgi:hypothetical protein
LVVAQNGGETRLFRNQKATPGLRVRVKGDASNPAGVGTRLRLEGRSHAGSAREIHAGSGYWSMDAPTQIMTLDEPALRLRVDWPGGGSSVQEIPSGVREVVVEPGMKGGSK